MKYVEQYIKESLKLQPLGEVKFEGLRTQECDETYEYSVMIDGKDSRLEIWLADYVMWLEDKLTELGFDNQQNKIHL
jgi:hypothetical protein